MVNPTDLDQRTSLIDLYDLSMEKRTGSYVLHEEEPTIIETSASPSIPHLLKGLEKLDIDPVDVKYIILTHIHLDHAGGVGVFLEKCPNAKVVVHPKGKRHLANPSKLIAGAKMVYGELFDQLFNPIVPVPEERLISKNDGESLQIGANRTLTFYDTPGHAKHHFSVHDSYSNGIFTGDTIGILYPKTPFEFILPTTSPNQFDPDAMLESLDRIEQLEVDSINFGHYGQSRNPEQVYEQMRYWLPVFMEIGEKEFTIHSDASSKEQADAISEALLKKIRKHLENKGVSRDHDVYQYLNMDMQVCSMGIVDYLKKK
ncbi:Glyoxylase, beta-lactamase superfamily II [Salinibacillus kushneri]|uniref:Glyoxylase, beta-lactamase superfamily II n=1 Tax=Salinibacillus kushneri TaxID=237682 RepID=A0A1I0ESF9_9BACI|nr:MBL fold metallo-hydrolase [Salinibacillus kushneri]SET47761.1 Glyoxylase, beta-lactamase superfamily II [Salinibacillus kushneri]